MSIINTADIGKLKKTKVAKAGDTMTGTLAFGDNVKATFGALAGGDLQIYSNGTHGIIKENGSGYLKLQAADRVAIRSSDDSEKLADFYVNGAVNLYHDNLLKLATTATGVDVTGTITCDGFTSADASSTFSNSASNLEVNFIANNSVIINTTSGTSEGTIIRCNKYYRIDTGGSVERLRIDASGNVGIGTNNPTNLLTCESTTSPQVSIKYDTTNYLNISHNKFEVVGSDFTINAFNSQSVILQTSNIERVRIDSSGNMGVGITPTEKLHVSGNIKVSGTVDGRDLATDGTKLDTVETNADVTDTANVTTAGALMTAGGAMTGAVTTSSTFDGRDVATDGTKLDTVETNADVTDTANVTTAGALMTAGGTLTGNLNLGDNNKAQFGAGNSLQIYATSTHSYITESGTGDLKILAENLELGQSDGTRFFKGVKNAQAEISYDGSVRIATTSTGINVTGSVSIDNGVATIASGTGTVSNAEMTLDTWAATEFQSAKYTITARGNGNKFQTSEILVFHDNANTAYITEYGIMSSDGTPFVTYLVDVTSGNVRLRATLDAAWSGGDNVKFTRFAQDII